MGFVDDLRQLSEQVKRRQVHVKGEEATKQAIVLPFLQVLGFDVYDPSEVQPEYIADFAKKRSNGTMEKVDFALRVGGQPAMFVECKAIDAAPEDHDGQLSRYFNATPSVRIAVVTNGLKYRFFTDLRAPNVMDPTPFLQFDILNFTERDADNLRTFTKDGFNPSAIQACAEEIIYSERLTSLVNELLRNPSENFVRFVLGELDLVSGRMTARVVERFTPIVKRAVQSTIVEMMTRSIQQEIAAPSPAPLAAPPAPPPGAPLIVAPVTQTAAKTPTTTSATGSTPPADGDGRPSREVVTTAEELELFDVVSRFVAESAHKRPIAHKDTATYFGINLGKVTQWFLRAYFNGPRKALLLRVPVEQAALLARGFEVEVAPEAMGKSRVYVSSAKDVEKLRALVLVAFEDEVRRVESGADADEDRSGG